MAKVLVIDDEKCIRVTVREFLQSDGHEIHVAEDTESAWNLLENKGFDVVVTDIMLPGLSGLDLLKSLHKVAPEVEVIMITGHPGVESVTEAMRGGALDYIRKPFSREQICKSVTNAAKVKAINDEKKRLEEANRKYREELEQLVEERTRDLRESEERLSLMADSLPVLIAYIDSDMRYRYVNAEYEKWFCLPRHKIIGRHPWELVGDETYQISLNNMEAALSGKTVTFELHLAHRKLGVRTNHTLLAPHKGANGRVNGFYLLSTDITERKRAEEEKEKMQAQLLQSQKLEAIGTLAAGVAHDFNNQLTAIQGYSDLIMMELDETNPLYRDVKQIRNAALRAAKLTRQLLLFSRKHPMEVASLNINNLIKDILKMLNRLIGEDISMDTDELEPDIWTIRADEGKIEQVIVNMVVNARDAMPNGGKIKIKTENVILDKNDCKLCSDAHPGKHLRLTISDTGAGMKKDIIPHIFEPFFSTKGAGKGTGLGLAVVYGIVDQHKGWIEVSSEPARGTTFMIYLPAVHCAPEAEKKQGVSLEGFQGNEEGILLVEDEEAVREYAGRVLRQYGYRVFVATDAKEAMEIFESERERIQLLFSDVVLPDKDGLELAEQILCSNPEIKVMIGSGYTDEKSQWPIIREKGYPFIHKPYSVPDLIKAIKETIQASPGEPHKGGDFS
jgi:PAS domain S-box-containing protein